MPKKNTTTPKTTKRSTKRTPRKRNTPETTQPTLPSWASETFDMDGVLAGVKEACYIRIVEQLETLNPGDLLLVDRSRKTPSFGDYVAWGDLNSLTMGYYLEGDTTTEPVFGVGVALIRRFELQRDAMANQWEALAPGVPKLQAQLDKLERVPENEAERFKLEKEIYKLEHKGVAGREVIVPDEWPDVIGGVQ